MEIILTIQIIEIILWLIILIQYQYHLFILLIEIKITFTWERIIPFEKNEILFSFFSWFEIIRSLLYLTARNAFLMYTNTIKWN